MAHIHFLEMPRDIVERILLEVPDIGARDLCALDRTCKPLGPLTEGVARLRLVRRSGGAARVPSLLRGVVCDDGEAVWADDAASPTTSWKRALWACEARDAALRAERALFLQRLWAQGGDRGVRQRLSATAQGLRALDALMLRADLVSLAVAADHEDPAAHVVGDHLLNYSIVAEFAFNGASKRPACVFTLAARVESPHGTLFQPRAAARLTCRLADGEEAVVFEHQVDEWPSIVRGDVYGFYGPTRTIASVVAPTSAALLPAARTLARTCGGQSFGHATRHAGDWALALAHAVRWCCTAAFMRPAAFDAYSSRESAVMAKLVPGSGGGVCAWDDDARRAMAEIVRRHPAHYDWRRHLELSAVDTAMEAVEAALAAG